MINVEARVNVGGGFDDLVPNIAAMLTGIWCGREIFRRGECQRFVEELVVATLICALVDLRHESIVKRKDGGEVVQSRDGRSWNASQLPRGRCFVVAGRTVYQDIILVDGRIIDLYALEVKMSLVILIQHPGG